MGPPEPPAKGLNLEEEAKKPPVAYNQQRARREAGPSGQDVKLKLRRPRPEADPACLPKLPGRPAGLDGERGPQREEGPLRKSLAAGRKAGCRGNAVTPWSRLERYSDTWCRLPPSIEGLPGWCPSPPAASEGAKILCKICFVPALASPLADLAGPSSLRKSSLVQKAGRMTLLCGPILHWK